MTSHTKLSWRIYILLIGLSTVFLTSVGYAIYKRGFWLVWNNGRPLSNDVSGVIIIAFAVAAFYDFTYESSEFRRLLKQLGVTFVSAVAVYLLIMFAQASYIGMMELYSAFLKAPPIAPSLRFLRFSIICPIVILVGSCLFYFRLRLRSIYGGTEALAGLAVAVQQVNSLPEIAQGVGGTIATPLLAPPEIFLPILTASVYLIVRGLEPVMN